MESCSKSAYSSPLPESLAAELEAWFAVPGDADDFIYYDQPPAHPSEK